ncbi:MAG: hypothetical protein IJV16_06705 [Lachnospiraceae bacterium]|nr:hypothetical protein [Lachnospiraceae bacterium]MBR1523487.1 hypothetical protein [Lachnospiraceae bacterium]
MNKYLWCWIFISILFLVWSLGSVAASRNNEAAFIHTWLGTIYLILGLLLILFEVFFWIIGMKKMIDEKGDEQNEE